MNMQDMVIEFHKAFGLVVNKSPNDLAASSASHDHVPLPPSSINPSPLPFPAPLVMEVAHAPVG